MVTVHELNTAILTITMKIMEKSPELSKYLEEMAVTIPDKNSPEITLKILKEYHHSLKTLLLKYEQEHDSDFVIKPHN
jgi:hypothetical protein